MKLTPLTILLALSLLLFTRIVVADSSVLVPKAAAAIAAGALVVDVRSADEFSSGHLPGALNIPHDEVTKRIAEFGSDKSREIVLYCRSGRRSGIAEEALSAAGFTAVTNGGGYRELSEAVANQPKR